MAMLQGNTYLKPVQVTDANNQIVNADRVVKGEFVFGDLYKHYGDGGDVYWNKEIKAFIVPLTEEDTFKLQGAVECQARLLLDDGSVSGSVPEMQYVYTSKSKTILSNGGYGTQSGEILNFKLLKELSVIQGITEETDPTVADYIKQISQSDISSWNSKATPDYVDLRIKELIGTAPGMLDTLEELANAINENKDLIDALKIPTKTSDLLNDSNFVSQSYVESAIGNVSSLLGNTEDLEA